MCLGHKRSQMKQLLPKTWITFITITVRQSRMFIMQVWWRFYDSLCSECWISCFGYCCEYEWYMCFSFSDVFLFSCFGWKVNISGQHGSDAGDLLLLVHHKVTRGVGLKWKIVTSVTYRGVTPFGPLVWQAEADTELTLSASPTTAVYTCLDKLYLFWKHKRTYVCTRKTPGPKRITHGNRKNDDIKEHKQAF